MRPCPTPFTVQSPHDGEHRYYAVSGTVRNVKPGWGEVRAENQYVVGPGSALTECKHGCCSPDSPGEYPVDRDLPVARIGVEDLPEECQADGAADDGEEVELSEPGEATEEQDLSDIEAPFDMQQRFEKAMNCAYVRSSPRCGRDGAET